MIYIKNEFNWKPFKSFKIKYNYEWKDPNLWIKHNGTWFQHVPPNCVIFYDTTPLKSLLADGTNSFTPNLIGKFFKAGANPGTEGGTLTHGNHGDSAVITTSSYTHLMKGVNYVLGPYFYKSNNSSHTHTVPIHSHPDLGDNLAGLNRQILKPYLYGAKLYSGAHIFGRGFINPLLNEIVFSGEKYYLQADLIPQLIDGVTHNHGTASGYTSTYSSAVTQVKAGDNNGTWYTSHNHSYDHTAQDIKPDASYYTTGLWKLSDTLSFDLLPSGTIMIFLTDLLPKGWSKITSAENHLLAFHNIDAIGGSETHIHSIAVTTSSMTNISGARAYHTGSAAVGRVVLNHSHTFTDLHNIEENHMPPYVEVILAIKN